MAQQVRMSHQYPSGNLLNAPLSRLTYRQRMVEYRARFDTNKNVQDLMKAKRLLIAGEDELKKAMYWHTENFNCETSLLIQTAR